MRISQMNHWQSYLHAYQSDESLAIIVMKLSLSLTLWLERISLPTFDLWHPMVICGIEFQNVTFTTFRYFFFMYYQAVLNVLKEESIDKSGIKLGGRELLDLIIRKWGVAYDIQLRKNKVNLRRTTSSFLYSSLSSLSL